MAESKDSLDANFFRNDSTEFDAMDVEPIYIDRRLKARLKTIAANYNLRMQFLATRLIEMALEERRDR